MKQITTNNRTLLFVEVPEDAYGFYIHYASEHLEFYRSKGFIQISKIKVGYDRKFIATTDTITEEQAEELVECMSRPTGGDDYMIYYKRYTGSQEDADFPWFSEMNNGASKSFASLLQHHSITGRHAIIEVL